MSAVLRRRTELLGSPFESDRLKAGIVYESTSIGKENL